jgi:uncharacterized protein (DUF1778 family)
MAGTKVKRRKSKAQRKEDSIRIRLTEAQKERFTAVSEKLGFTLSSWVLSCAVREADRLAKEGTA